MGFLLPSIGPQRQRVALANYRGVTNYKKAWKMLSFVTRLYIEQGGKLRFRKREVLDSTATV